MPEKLTQSEFSRHLNTTFNAKLEDGRVEKLQLVEVKPYAKNVPEESGMERFSAFFVGPDDIHLPQQTYALEHDQMGELEIFLVPIGHNEKGYRYEAVFNYFLKQAND